MIGSINISLKEQKFFMNIYFNILSFKLFFTTIAFGSMPLLKQRHAGPKYMITTPMPTTPNIESIVTNVIATHNAKNIDFAWEKTKLYHFKKKNYELIIRIIEPNLQLIEIIAKEHNTERKRAIIDSKDLRKELNTFLVDLIS